MIHRVLWSSAAALVCVRAPCSKLRRDAFPRLTSSRRPLAMASVVGEKEIDLTKLNIQQLSSLKGELEQEVENLTRAYATLKDAQSRLMSCRNTVTDMGSTHSGTEILVPLTQSMYVPGRIADSGKVLIDIGTGYYVEKSLPKAKEYLDRRLTMVGQNVDSLQKVLVQKEQTVRAITGYMQRRFVMRQEPEGGNS